MKKLLTLVTITSLLAFGACKSEKKGNKNDVSDKTKKSSAAFVVSDANNSIGWVAYKFTEKTPVKGKFNTINIISGGEGKTVKEAINNTAFEIPVSSIFTSDSSRDFKIRKYFFGIMPDPKLLSGKLMIETDSTGVADITMNGVTQKLPFSYTIENKKFEMKATMDILNWNAQESIDSLNAICKDLHKGLDGVSKLWSEVTLDISSTFK